MKKKYIVPNCICIDIDTTGIIAGSKPNGNWKDEHTNPGGHQPPGHNKNSLEDPIYSPEYRNTLWD